MSTPNLLSAPIELAGAWAPMLSGDVLTVLSRMREACLQGVRLVSDRQPAKLRVEEHSSGPPAIWLHTDVTDTAWIIVDIDSNDWCKLAYQFGHELGHVLCNSWQWRAKPSLPTQWLEEALVEAFSIRGLGLLADSWERNPPFPNNASFAASIRKYRQNLIDGYATGTVPLHLDTCGWFKQNRTPLDETGGLNKIEGPEILAILSMYESNKNSVEDLGALNRWPERSALPIERYIRSWQASCAEIDAPGLLPKSLAQSLCLD